MKISELITELEKFIESYGDVEVCVDGYESGLTSVSRVEVAKIKENVNTDWWQGEHEEVFDDNGVLCCHIPR